MVTTAEGGAGKAALDFVSNAITEKLAAAVSVEAAALSFLANHMPHEAATVVELLVGLKGKLIFTGIGKSGAVAQKCAATFSSLGIPAFFLHPHDALHGDIGVVQSGDCLFILSKSGQGDEFNYLFSSARQRQVVTILLCCSRGECARYADYVIEIPCAKEACLLNLAPTASSTLMLALGDALAVVVSSFRGFSRDDFARNHPAGTLGKHLLLTVEQLMHSGEDLPLVAIDATFIDIIVTVTTKKLGCAVVFDRDARLSGIITDGDIRRGCKRGADVFSITANQFMSKKPKTVQKTTLARDAFLIMESFNITVLVVLDNGNVVGIVHIHDLIKAGIKGVQ